MPRKPANLLYGVDDKPPIWISIVLAIQHIFFLSSGLIVATIVMRQTGVPSEITVDVVSMAMMAGGIATILQTLRKGPIGSGYLCTEGIDPTFLSVSVLAGSTGGTSLIFGMTVTSGVIECFLGRILNRLRVLFPPEVTGVVLTMVGLSIVPIMTLNFFGVKGGKESIHLPNIIIASITLAAMAGTNIWSKGRLRLYSVIIGIGAGYTASLIFGIFTHDNLKLLTEASLFSLPNLSHIGYAFDLRLLVPIIVATLASTLKSVATLTMCQKVNDAEWTRPDLNNIGKGTFADGLASVVGGLLGGMGQSLYASSVGLSVASGATSRIIAFFTGGIFICLAFLPKLSAIYSIMPKPVMGGALVFMVCFMVISGIQIMTSRMIDIRRTFVVAVSLMFGLSVDIFPGLYHHVHPYLQPIFSSSLAVGTILAIVLNLIVRIGITSHKVLELVPGVDTSSKIFDFLQNQGAVWGARKEVIQKAEMALNEFFESVVSSKLTAKNISADVSFDEFNLDIVIRYKGKAMEFPEAGPSPQELLTDDRAALNLSGYIVRKLTDRISSEEKDGNCFLKMHFNH
jgi:xanthine permease XanP